MRKVQGETIGAKRVGRKEGAKIMKGLLLGMEEERWNKRRKHDLSIFSCPLPDCRQTQRRILHDDERVAARASPHCCHLRRFHGIYVRDNAKLRRREKSVQGHSRQPPDHSTQNRGSLHR